MMKIFLIILIAVFVSCVKDSPSKPDVANNSSQTNQNINDDEIRAVLCDINNGNYTNAQNSLENILQKDPQNIYAQRLLPGVLAKQIKKDDTSPENITKIRKAIEAFEQFLKNPQISADENAETNSFIVSLHGLISEAEKTSQLLKRVEDKNQTPQMKSRYYEALAAQFYTCASDISESVMKIVKQNGKDIFVFTKPEKAEDFEKLKECTTKGTELVEKALELDSKNEGGWSYKSGFLIQKMRIAEMEGKSEEKESLKKESEAAIAKFRAVADEANRRRAESEKLPESPEKQPDINELAEELTVYKREIPINQLVKEIYIPNELTSVEPVPLSDAPVQEETDSTLAKNDENQKREWKEFSPEGDEFTADLPNNAESDLSGVITASSEGLRFIIISQPKPSLQSSNLDDAVLNTLARSVVIPAVNSFLLGDSPGSLEAKLVRKDNFAGQPSRQYAFTVTCSGKKEGIIIVLIGKTRNYGIIINGANEQDARTQRFLKSWKIKDAV